MCYRKIPVISLVFRQLHKAYWAGLTTKEEKLEEGSYRGTGYFFEGGGGGKLKGLFPSHSAEPKLEFYIMYLSEYSSFFFTFSLMYMWHVQKEPWCLLPIILYFFLIASRPSLAPFQRLKCSIDSILGTMSFLQTPQIYARIWMFNSPLPFKYAVISCSRYVSMELHSKQ